MAIEILGSECRLRQGADNALERTFNGHAIASWRALPPRLRELALALFKPGVRHKPGSDTGALLQRGILWRPPGWRGIALAPWVCRAAFQEERLDIGSRNLLRSTINCRPLASAIASRCLAMEQSLRARVAELLEGANLGEQAERAFQHYQAHGIGLPSELYPQAHPSVPEKIDFAGIGDISDALREARADGRWLGFARELAKLRNAVLHGHYPSWLAVSRTVGAWRDLERLGGRP